MNKLRRKFAPIWTILPLALLIVVGCATTNGSSQEGMKVTLSGAQEVPPVKTAATGTATVTIKSDKSVSGRITTTGIDATAAHIHEGEAGKKRTSHRPVRESRRWYLVHRTGGEAERHSIRQLLSREFIRQCP